MLPASMRSYRVKIGPTGRAFNKLPLSYDHHSSFPHFLDFRTFRVLLVLYTPLYPPEGFALRVGVSDGRLRGSSERRDRAGWQVATSEPVAAGRTCCEKADAPLGPQELGVCAGPSVPSHLPFLNGFLTVRSPLFRPFQDIFA